MADIYCEKCHIQHVKDQIYYLENYHWGMGGLDFDDYVPKYPDICKHNLKNKPCVIPSYDEWAGILEEEEYNEYMEKKADQYGDYMEYIGELIESRKVLEKE